MRHKLEPLSSLEPQCDVQGIRLRRHQRDTTDEQTKGTHESSSVVLVSVHMLQVCVHVKHVVVVVLLCVRNTVVVSVPTYSLFTGM